MSKEVPNQETVSKEALKIDEDTSFDIYYDIYDEKYLYIKLQENTALAPFYYNVSYNIDELRVLDDIFKAIEIDKVKGHLKDLFDNNKIKLEYKSQDKKVIIMRLEVALFFGTYTIDFELDKVMIPEDEKDEMLNKLYNRNKEKLNFAKELFVQFHSNANLYKNILDILSANFDMSGVIIKNINTNENNNIANNNSLENSNINESSILEKSDIVEDKEKFENRIKKIFKNKKGVNLEKTKDGNMAVLNLKNRTKTTWNIGFFKFKLVKIEDNNSKSLTLKNIDYPIYEIKPKEEGDFIFYFEEIKQPGDYKCIFDIYINGQKIDYAQLNLVMNLSKDE
jgi:hypothetical protein